MTNNERKKSLSESITAIKCVQQHFQCTDKLQDMMQIFRRMVNDCIRIGLESNVSNRIRLTRLCYHDLERYDIYSIYKISAISHAAGILGNRKTSLRRGFEPRYPYARKLFLATYAGFKIADGILKVPLGNRQYFDIPLNNYVRKTFSDPTLKVRSITLTAASTVSICYSKAVAKTECTTMEGVDRNLRNLTVGNENNIVQYELSKAVDIRENTRSIIRSFNRNDVRIHRTIASKYGSRQKNRIRQLLHHISKVVIEKARQDKAAIVFEDIRRIRRLYRRGNYQGRNYRSKLNGWSFAEIKRQIEYKAAWEGIPVIQLSVGDTRGTSQLCPRCGKKITQEDRRTRQLRCDQCKKWMDRDVVAAMNLSIKGRSRFERSQGLAGEAMVQECGSTEPLILKVDASKLSLYRQPKADRVVLQPRT